MGHSVPLQLWTEYLYTIMTSPWSITTSLVVIAITLWLLRWYCPGNKLPPGTMGIPILGETIQFVLQPTKFFQSRELKHGFLYKTHILFNPTACVSGAKIIRKILLDKDNCLSIEWPRGMRVLLGEHALGQSSGSHHRFRKKAVLKTFSPANLETYFPIVLRTITEELAHWGERDAIVVYQEVQKLTLKVACHVILGLPPSDLRHDIFIRAFNDFANGFFNVAIPIPGTAFYKALVGRRCIQNLINERIVQIQKELDSGADMGISDVLSHLVSVGELTTAEIQDLVRELCFAGYETVAGTMSVLVMLLGRHPAVLQRVREEIEQESSVGGFNVTALNRMKYCRNVFKEMLRLFPPIGGGFRKVKKTIELQGFTIPKGWTLIYSVWNTHRLSNLFDQSDHRSFNPDQWETSKDTADTMFHYIPFGAGVRACVGKSYATLVLRVFMVVLASNCDWSLCSQSDEVTIVPVMKPKDGLPAVFNSRKNPELGLVDH